MLVEFGSCASYRGRGEHFLLLFKYVISACNGVLNPKEVARALPDPNGTGRIDIRYLALRRMVVSSAFINSEILVSPERNRILYLNPL